ILGKLLSTAAGLLSNL
uniref:Alyteserin-2a n=1 Tax=Alytes obstetricans TaxID=8443 RepID=ATI2A_ALYOB|nr:RecName: Full=Alyteserin-2a [Alytes obstetricans]